MYNIDFPNNPPKYTKDILYLFNKKIIEENMKQEKKI